jgi:hypothetical protein
MKQFVFFSIILFCTLSYGQNTDSLYKKKIIGKWISEQDKRYEMIFTNTSKFDYYDNKLESIERYRIQNDSLIAMDKSSGDQFIYSLETVSEKYLSLMYLPRGNLLLFRRKKIKQPNTGTRIL